VGGKYCQRHVGAEGAGADAAHCGAVGGGCGAEREGGHFDVLSLRNMELEVWWLGADWEGFELAGLWESRYELWDVVELKYAATSSEEIYINTEEPVVLRRGDSSRRVG